MIPVIDIVLRAGTNTCVREKKREAILNPSQEATNTHHLLHLLGSCMYVYLASGIFIVFRPYTRVSFPTLPAGQRPKTLVGKNGC